MVDCLRDSYRVSERHACRVLLVVRGTYRYQCHREPWTELRMRIREIAQSRVRYGYRKIRVLLNREGWGVGKYLVYRLYKEEGLALKKRPSRKRRAARHREQRFEATAPNQAWSMDFVADQLQDGRRFRSLTTSSPFRLCPTSMATLSRVYTSTMAKSLEASRLLKNGELRCPFSRSVVER
jgi:putative transposase